MPPLSAAFRTFRYGDDVAQAGDLYLPNKPNPPVVCLLHGGFWRMPFGREQLGAIASDLAARGLAVWNLGYRRTGASGGGFPGTLLDVDAGIDHLAVIAAEGVGLDLERVVVAGHSAGGHLALWSAARRRSNLPGVSGRIRPIAVAGLAPICDLESACASSVGGGAVKAFLGGAPTEVPDRYGAASPLSLLPLRVRQLLVHGVEDGALPISASRAYVETAKAAGDTIDFIELPGVGHMEFVDPSSDAFGRFRLWLERVLL